MVWRQTVPIANRPSENPELHALCGSSIACLAKASAEGTGLTELRDKE
jgi:hypothetical protein